MAGQGTYSAYMPLKPTELKVGDMYGKYIDDFIKRGEAENAAKAKLLSEEKKNIRDLMKDINVNHFATVSNFQDMGNKMFQEVASAIAKSKILAETDFENRYKHISNAQKLSNDYKMIAGSFSNKDFIDKYNAKMSALQNGDLFLDSSENERLQILSKGMWDYRIGEKGIEFALPPSGDSTLDDPVRWYSPGEVINLYTAPDELDLLRNTKSNGNNGFIDTIIPKVAKEMQDAFQRNEDGNKTIGWKGFALNRAGQWFDNLFGEYEANNVPRELIQYAKKYLKKSIDSKDDYDEVKNGLVGLIGSYVPEENKKDTKYTDAQLRGQLLDNQLKGLKIQELQAKKARGWKSDSGSKTPVNILTGQDIMRHWGNGNGQVLKGATIFSKDGKEAILGYKFLNKDGKGYHTRYATALYDTNGRLVFRDWETTGSANTKLMNLGIDPLMARQTVLKGETASYSKESRKVDDNLKSKGYKAEVETEEGW